MKLAILGAFVGLLIGCANQGSTPAFKVSDEVVLRGPYNTDLDNQFTALKLGSGLFAAFTGNGNVRRQVGQSVVDAASIQGTLVVGYGDGILYWLNHVGRSNGQTYGLFHSEDHIDYNNNFQTHKAMNIGFSDDEGQTWTTPQPVITSPEAWQVGKSTGEGDCNAVDGQDGYLYAYCLRVKDYQTIVARAAQTDVSHWLKYYNGSFTEPGVGGASSSIGYVGMSPAIVKGQRVTLMTDGHTVSMVKLVNGLVNAGQVAMFTTDSALYPVLVNAEASNIITDSGYVFYTKTVDGKNYLAYRTITF